MSYDVNPISCNYIRFGDKNLPGSSFKKNLCGELLYGFHNDGEKQSLEINRLEYALETTGQFVGWISLALGKVISEKEITTSKVFSTFASVDDELKINGFLGIKSVDAQVNIEGCRQLYADIVANTANEESFKTMGQCLLGLNVDQEPIVFKYIDTTLAAYTLFSSFATFAIKSVSLAAAVTRKDAIFNNDCKFSFAASAYNLFLCNRNMRNGFKSSLRCYLSYNILNPVRVRSVRFQEDPDNILKFILSNSIEFYKPDNVPDEIAGSFAKHITGYLTSLLKNNTLHIGTFTTDCNLNECCTAQSRAKLIKGLYVDGTTLNNACVTRLVDVNANIMSKLIHTTNCSGVAADQACFGLNQKYFTSSVVEGGGELTSWNTATDTLNTKFNYGSERLLKVEGLYSCMNLLNINDPSDVLYRALYNELLSVDDIICLADGLISDTEPFCGPM